MGAMIDKLDEPGDIIIPVIEIVDGWAADSMETVEDCEDAHIKCMALIAEIEFQIDLCEARPQLQRDLEWLARAKRALKYKKLAAQIVSNCRGRITKAERRASQAARDQRLLETLKKHVAPDLFARCLRDAEFAPEAV